MVTTALATRRELNGERKHAMNLKPLGDRIIVKQDEAQETTAGGLYIAAESKEKPQSGVVLAVGEGKVNNEGEHLPMPVKAGDHVLYGKYGGTEVDVEGEKVLILRADDIYPQDWCKQHPAVSVPNAHIRKIGPVRP